MNNSRLADISNRIAVQGLLTLQDLIDLENIDVDLTEYVDREEVSRGNVDYDKYSSYLRVRMEGL